jgi:hypothetical protein
VFFLKKNSWHSNALRDLDIIIIYCETYLVLQRTTEFAAKNEEGFASRPLIIGRKVFNVRLQR